MGSNINLYLKTEYSLLTSLIKIDDLPQTLKKLGYENFVQMGYDRMLRTDYNAKMVKEYR